MACFCILLSILISTNMFINLAMCRPLITSSSTSNALQMLLKPEFVANFANPPIKAESLTVLDPKLAESPAVSQHNRHKPFDKSFAGGKIIVGGLALAILVSVFCYIRITRRRSSDLLKS